MKKILVVVSFILAAFSFQANAATYNLGTINDFESFSGYLTKDNGYSETWNFKVLFQSVVSASATNTASVFKGKIVGKVKDFSATLDGISLDLASLGNAQFLSIDNLLASAGDHSLVISGSSDGSYGGSIAVAQTPIPAAVWLFGSALMGMMGVSRRKKA
jgi:hypothetical protein